MIPSTKDRQDRVGALLAGLVVTATLVGAVGLAIDSWDYDYWFGWMVLLGGPAAVLLAILLPMFFYAVVYTLVHGKPPEWMP